MSNSCRQAAGRNTPSPDGSSDRRRRICSGLRPAGCGPCKALTEEIKKIDFEVPIYEFDVESDIEFSQKFKVRNVPTVKLFKNGEDVHTFLGLKSADTINGLINEYILN